MKRSIASSRPEPSSTYPQAIIGPNSQKLTTNDALQYLKDVKENFRNSPRKYEEFLEVMKDFKAQRIQTEGVIARVKDLFEGNRYLTLGFNNFLPKDYQITLDEEENKPQPKKPVEFEEAISFVNKIKTRFQGDDRVYKAFLEILNMYRKDNKAISEVYHEVSALFSDHPDLLTEFRHFLPDTSANVLPINNKNSTRLLHGEKKLVTSNADRERSVDGPNIDIERARAGKRLAERDIERENREREYADRDFDHNGQQISQTRKPSRVVEEFAGEQFPKGENSSYGIYSREFAFWDKVKERFGNSAYEDFYDFIENYNREKISRSEYEYQVSNFFGRNHDLAAEFIDLFPNIMNIDGFLAAMRKRSSKSLIIEDRDRNPDRERTLRDRERGVALGTNNVSTQRVSIYMNKDKYAYKPIQELDLSDCEQCTPSYRLLPYDYPIPIASQKTTIGAVVLNDHWVSVTSGSEDYSFKHMRKNQFEESLFRCEDDRFELDMLLGQFGSTIKRIEELMKKFADKSVEFDSNFRITDHLSVLNLRSIERIYTEHWLETLEVLKKDAPGVLPTILSRLKQKQLEGAGARVEYNKVWGMIYAQNHQKSLDHRSFYFKQQDARSLNAKALVEEIKELREKTMSENYEMIIATFIGILPPVIPEMEFTFSDSEIHDDLYKLIEYSCGELCSGEELKKALNIWKSFLEPMLGVSRTRNSSEINKNGIENGSKDDDFSNGNLENAENASGVAAISTRQGNDENIISLEGNEAIEANENSNGSIINGPIGPLRVEREEGELSPNGDFEEDNFATHGNNDVAIPRLIQGSENASENGGESHEDKAREDDIFGLILPSSQTQLQNAKPIVKYIFQKSQQLRERNSMLFYGNEFIYVLLRLHQVLYERIQTVKARVSEKDLYSRFLSALYKLLNGSFDNSNFEDECRSIIGTQSYLLFTLDRLVFKIVKQLQAIASDESTKNMFHLHTYENSRSFDAFDEAMYYGNACAYLQEEYLYRIECLRSPTRLSIQLLANVSEKSEEKTSEDPKFENYIDECLSSTPQNKLQSPVFLKSNMRKYPGNESEQYLSALEEVQITNGLEIRLTQTSIKMRYVLGTEDVLYRPRQKSKKVNRNGLSYDKAKSSNKFLTRAEKFNMWLSGP